MRAIQVGFLALVVAQATVYGLTQSPVPVGPGVSISPGVDDEAPVVPEPSGPNEGLVGIVRGTVSHAVTGTPIAGARVILTPQAVTARQQAFPVASRDRRLVVADGEGRFEIEVRPGPFEVGVEAAGLFLAPGTPGQLTVSGGQILDGLRITLVPGGAISGRVVDFDGNPVSTVAVSAVRPRYQDGRRWVGPCDSNASLQTGGAWQSTDERGEYRLTGLEPGEYYVAALEGRDCDRSATYFPGVVDPAHAAPVRVVAAGEASGIFIRWSHDAGYQAQFEIEDLTGHDSATIAAQIVRQDPSRRTLSSLTLTRIGSADSTIAQIGEHRFITPPLPPGSYEMYLSPVGSASVGRTTFDLVDGDIDAGRIVLHPVVPVRGRFRMAPGIDSELSYDRLYVVVEPYESWHPSLWIPLRVRPRATGEFFSADAYFDGLSEGRYRIRVLGLPPDVYVASVRYGTEDVSQGFLSLRAASADQWIEVTLDRPGGTVEGVVRDRAGDPVPGSRVVLIPSANRRQDTSLFSAAVTDQTGRFAFSSVRPGDYGVLAWADVPNEAWTTTEFLSGFETRMERIRIGAGDHETLELPVMQGND